MKPLVRHPTFLAAICVLLFIAVTATAGAPLLTVPDGFVVEQVAGTPLVTHPMMAGFDDTGRLFVAESAGMNLNRAELEKDPPNFIRMLEDTDDDGHFDKSTIFADRMHFPMGALWHEGALYVASPPHIWRLQDTNGDGVADRRDPIVSKFGYTGNAASVHGCFLGPTGRIFWCFGRHGYELETKKGKSGGIFSCKPDGSDPQMHCGGGFDNPVEIAFTPEGEILGTVNIFNNRPRNDCVVHWMHGGLYPRRDMQQVLGEFKRTGDLLDPLISFGHVTVAGMMRYRGKGLGPSFDGNLFVTHFNTNRVVRVRIERDGSTFRGKFEDFLIAESPDFRPTDVLQDADGSLLVIDTGGWFRIGCPESKVARPEIRGAIYRVRRQGAAPKGDPRGRRIAWKGIPLPELVNRLDDDRFAVRDRAIAELARQGDRTADILSTALNNGSVRSRRNCVWTLGRIGSRAARTGLRKALADKEVSVRQAAAYCVGMLSDTKAIEPLARLVVLDTPPMRREAATALGRIGSNSAVPAILKSLGDPVDRTLEHALIYALIQINQADATAAGLEEEDPQIRRAALIALDQMDDQVLRRQTVTALLESDHAPLQQTAIQIITARGWTGQLAGRLAHWLEQPVLSDHEWSMVRGALLALLSEEPIRKLVGRCLAETSTADTTRRGVLELIARVQLGELPPQWQEGLTRCLDAPAIDTRLAAVKAIGAIRTDHFDEPLRRLAHDEAEAETIRLSAMVVLGDRVGVLPAPLFQLLSAKLEGDHPDLHRLDAAAVLGRAQLNEDQRRSLISAVQNAGPLELPVLLGAFEQLDDREVSEALIAALRQSPGLWTLPADRITFLFKLASPELRQRSLALIAGQQTDMDQKARLDELEPALDGGDPTRGEALFFTRTTTACAMCHRVGDRGGAVGPDLTTIGRVRNRLALLEAIVFPSATFARGYEPLTIFTRDGEVHGGVIRRQSLEAIYLVNARHTSQRIDRSEIDSMTPSRISVMPQGFAKILSPEQLADLVAYLKTLQ